MAYDVGTRPARWTAAQAARRERTVWLWAASFFLAAGVILTALIAGGSGVGLVVAAPVLAFVLVANRRGEQALAVALRWQRGALAEEAVGNALDELRREGWTLMHDVRQIGEGNIDHIAAGPTGVYLIETKATRYDLRHLTKVKRQAAKVHRELGVWVTPVVCLHDRAGSQFRTDGVWVVPRARLLQWLRAQKNPPVPFERLARFADRVPDA